MVVWNDSKFEELRFVVELIIGSANVSICEDIRRGHSAPFFSIFFNVSCLIRHSKHHHFIVPVLKLIQMFKCFVCKLLSDASFSQMTTQNGVCCIYTFKIGNILDTKS